MTLNHKEQTVEDELPVAIGELYHQNSSTKYWSLKKFVLSGIYLIYFNRDGEKKGQWDITDCIINKVSAKEVGMPAAIYSFSLITTKKYFLVCASNERNREMWMKLISEQIIEFKEEIRRFLRTGEIIYGKGLVRRRGSIVDMLTSSFTHKLVLTNYPRILLVDTVTISLKDQYTWTIDNPPKISKITDIKFKIKAMYPNSNKVFKEWVFEDKENGSAYWEDIFKRFPDMKYYVPKRRASVVIDYQDSDVNDESYNVAMRNLLRETKDTNVSVIDSNKTGANEDAANRAAARRKLQSLLDKLRAIDDLVENIDNEIAEIDQLTLTPSQHDEIISQATSIVTSRRLHLIAEEDEYDDDDDDNGNNSNNNEDDQYLIDLEVQKFLKMFQDEKEERKNQLNLLKENVLHLSGSLHHAVGDQSADSNNDTNDNDLLPHYTSATNPYYNISESDSDSFKKSDIHMVTNNEPFSAKSNFNNIDVNDIDAVILETKRVLKIIHEEPTFYHALENNAVSHFHKKSVSMYEMFEGCDSSMSVVEQGSQMEEICEFVPPTQRHMTMFLETIASDGNSSSSSHQKTQNIIKLRPTIGNKDILQSCQAEYDKLNKIGLKPLSINKNNFDPSDPRMRPPEWTQIKLKRVLVDEYGELLNKTNNNKDFGYANYTQYLKSRNQRLATEENKMLNEINEKGVLFSMPVLKKTNIWDAAVTVTNDNFDANNVDKRPVAWQAVKLRRVIQREEHAHALLNTNNITDLNTNIDSNRNIKNSTNNEDTNNINSNNRMINLRSSNNTTDTTHSTTNVAVATINLNAQDNERNRKESLLAEESLMMKEIATYGELQDIQLLISSNSSTTATTTALDSNNNNNNKAMINSSLNTVTTTESSSSSSVSTNHSHSHSIDDTNNNSAAAVKSRIVHNVNTASLQNPPQSSTQLLLQKSQDSQVSQGGMASLAEDLKALNINMNNFDVTTGKRPKGWTQVRNHRVSLLDTADRQSGLAEKDIISKRMQREEEVEQVMIQEASVLFKIKAIEARLKMNKTTSGPLFPKNYTGHVNLNKDYSLPSPRARNDSNASNYSASGGGTSGNYNSLMYAHHTHNIRSSPGLRASPSVYSSGLRTSPRISGGGSSSSGPRERNFSTSSQQSYIDLINNVSQSVKSVNNQVIRTLEHSSSSNNSNNANLSLVTPPSPSYPPPPSPRSTSSSNKLYAPSFGSPYTNSHAVNSGSVSNNKFPPSAGLTPRTPGIITNDQSPRAIYSPPGSLRASPRIISLPAPRAPVPISPMVSIRASPLNRQLSIQTPDSTYRSNILSVRNSKDNSSIRNTRESLTSVNSSIDSTESPSNTASSTPRLLSSVTQPPSLRISASRVVPPPPPPRTAGSGSESSVNVLKSRILN